MFLRDQTHQKTKSEILKLAATGELPVVRVWALACPLFPLYPYSMPDVLNHAKVL